MAASAPEMTWLWMESSMESFARERQQRAEKVALNEQKSDV